MDCSIVKSIAGKYVLGVVDVAMARPPEYHQQFQEVLDSLIKQLVVDHGVARVSALSPAKVSGGLSNHTCERTIETICSVQSNLLWVPKVS